MCKEYMWLKYRWVKVNIGGDMTKYVLTNKKCPFWQTGQSQNFLVLCELPHQTNPRISWVTD